MMKKKTAVPLVLLLLISMSPMTVLGDIFTAIQNGKTDEAIAIVKKNPRTLADRDEKFGAQPLSWACLHGNSRLVTFFLSKGAPIEGRNFNQDTALMLASTIGDETVMQLLLDHGAKINVENKGKGTPLTSAIITAQSTDAALLLLRHEASVTDAVFSEKTPLHLAVFAGMQRVVKEMISRGADVNAQDMFGYTPLIYASGLGNEVVVKQLLTAGADPDISGTDGLTARSIAKSEGKPHVVEILSQAKNAWAKTIDHNYAGVGSVNASLLFKGKNVQGKVDVFIDNSRDLVLLGRGLGSHTLKQFPISQTTEMADAIQKAFTWGKKASMDRVEGHKRLYEDTENLPFFIIGFSALEQGQQWSVNLVFTESVDDVYVFGFDPAATELFCQLLRKARTQQLSIKTNDRKMSNFK